jgi:ribonuclease G
VNTGSYVGSKNFEETVLKTNLEAASAIARQLRLRNLGGIILIDFIDMVSDEQRELVRSELARQLARDPVRSHIHGFTALGLMELTRKRVRESLAHVMMQACECCAQIGQVKTAQTVAYDILREIELQARQFSAKGFKVLASQAVVAWFEQGDNTFLADLEVAIDQPISIVVSDGVPSDQYAVVLSN